MQLPCITRRLLGIEVPALSHRACSRYTSSSWIASMDKRFRQYVGGFFQVMYVMSYADYPEWQLSFAALK